MSRTDHSRYRRKAGKKPHMTRSHRAAERRALHNGDWDHLPQVVPSASFRTGFDLTV